MAKLCCIMLMLLNCINFGFSQSVYKIPFGSSGNTIELSVENESATIVNNVQVSATDIPVWLHLSHNVTAISQIKPKTEKYALFTFSVDKSSPVEKGQSLKFSITDPSGEVWVKTIAISVVAPE